RPRTCVRLPTASPKPPGNSGLGPLLQFFFFFNDTATTEIYTLSLHDALPIFLHGKRDSRRGVLFHLGQAHKHRSEEHTSELQSLTNLVCRLLLEKKKHTY